MSDEKFYYIVNPKGCIHIVSEADAKSRLKIIGWRLATAEERALYEQAEGNQRHNKPLVTPFVPMTADAETLEGAEFVPATRDMKKKVKPAKE